MKGNKRNTSQATLGPWSWIFQERELGDEFLSQHSNIWENTDTHGGIGAES